jgi:AcrR family transcriptional regulator
MSDASTFERARRPEHKEQRRLAILNAACAAATERGVRNVTLGDIATAAGMAKSNVLRYFGTREEIYLELCLESFKDWLSALGEAFEREQPSGPGAAAHVVATSLADWPMLCDLLSQHAATLEHNVRPEHGAAFKVAMLAATADLGMRLAEAMPELQGEKIFELGAVTFISIAAIWPTCTTPEAITALMDPAILALLPATFAERLERMLHPLYVGVLAT